VLTFHIPEALLNLHTAFINRHDLCRIPLALSQVAGKQPWFTLASGGLSTQFVFLQLNP
jgi:hypothetical protein